MDTFMDKLAQKLNAGEIIKANREADTEELEKLRRNLKDYEECLEQMYRINQELKNTAEGMVKTAGDMGKAVERKIEEASFDCTRMEEELVRLNLSSDRQQKQLQDTETRLNENIHKENVKVYRNVQAVIVEENAKQTAQLEEMRTLLAEMKAAGEVQKTPGIWKAILGVSVTALLVSAAALAFQVLEFLQII